MGPTGTWVQVKDGKGGGTGQVTADKGSREGLLVTAQRGREAQTSGGGRRVAAPSRWTVDPRPGKLGGDKRVQQDNKAASTGGIRGSNGS